MKTPNGNYRITQQDIAHAFTLITRECVDGETLNEREAYLQRLGFEAHVMHIQTGSFPTVAEVHAKWDGEQMRNNNSPSERR